MSRIFQCCFLAGFQSRFRPHSKHRLFARTNALDASIIFACLTAATFAHANDALKAQSALGVQRAQSQAAPTATIAQPATTTLPVKPQTSQLNPQPLPPKTEQPQSQMPSKPTQSPAFPNAPAPISPPAISDTAKAQATSVSPVLRTADAITGLADGARGVVAGESLTIRGRGFGASAGRVEISVQTGLASNAQLPFRVTQWSETEIIGSVGASNGLADGKAAIAIFPAGRSVADAIYSSQSSAPGANVNGWRFRFTASRAEQSLAMNGLGSALTSNYPTPTPQLIPYGSGLLKGLAVARRYQAGAYACTEASPADRYKVALASGFELVRVAANDLNANKRYGLAPPTACDVRAMWQSPQFLRTAADGTFVVSPAWETINRFGEKSKIKGCDGSRSHGVTKTPLGLDWDNMPADRCAANAEYVIDHIIVRGPAGLNPLTGGAINGAAIK